eukprot:2359469-Prymnesium_polylepis.1
MRSESCGSSAPDQGVARTRVPKLRAHGGTQTRARRGSLGVRAPACSDVAPGGWGPPGGMGGAAVAEAGGAWQRQQQQQQQQQKARARSAVVRARRLRAGR